MSKITQYDASIRVVSALNLKALCYRVSGTSHSYELSSVSRSRATVTYSNPDEHGSPHPINAIYPVIPNDFDKDNPLVVIGHLLRTTGETFDEDWQLFQCLNDHPPLFHTNSGWWTGEEILYEKASEARPDLKTIMDQAVRYLVFQHKKTWDEARKFVAEDILSPSEVKASLPWSAAYIKERPDDDN